MPKVSSKATNNHPQPQTPPPAWKGMSIGRPPKHDYNGDDFYDEVFFLAFNGATDAEIASAMGLSDNTFNQMKSGDYEHWQDEKGKAHTERLVKVLARARRRIVQAIRGKYLQAALGGQEVENVTTTTRHLKIDGQVTDDEEVQVTRTKTKTLPNMQALATLLYHHDPEWRKVQRGLDEESSDIPQEIESGVDICKWIEQEVATNAKS